MYDDTMIFYFISLFFLEKERTTVWLLSWSRDSLDCGFLITRGREKSLWTMVVDVRTARRAASNATTVTVQPAPIGGASDAREQQAKEEKRGRRGHKKGEAGRLRSLVPFFPFFSASP